VQEQIGFRYIRGHGLFNEDLAILTERRNFDGTTVREYNFTYLDMIMDGYLELNIRPFLELGFMPSAIASGDQTVFYWNGNVTPPKDYAEWNDLVQTTLRHLIARYGADEVTSWPVEVWNEPNLAGFWKDADRNEYFRLFKETITAVKAVDSRFRVGGPAICGVDDESWLRDFLDFCKAERLPLDFVTRHLYTIDVPEISGQYGYPKLRPLAEATDETKGSRKIIDEYDEFRGMEMHVTEFNTSYSPRTPIHDTNLNAAYTANLLSRLGDESASYSYWTFGDVFEEQGVPSSPFHGGFGLVANGMIPKPTFYAFQFFKELGKNECVHRSEDAVVVKTADGGYRGVVWNPCFGDGDPDEPHDLLMIFKLPVSGEVCIVTKSVGPVTCNPLKLWHDMGEPLSLSARQLKLLRESSAPRIISERTTAESNFEFAITSQKNTVIYFEVSPVPATTSGGYDYARAEKA
jgi:xylan 1,4-beta-xylosidase